VPITNLRIVDPIDPALNAVDATTGFDVNELTFRRMVWAFEQLNPGQKIDLQINCECRQAANIQNQVIVTADGNIRQTSETATQILEAATEEARTTSPPVAAAGNLAVSIADLAEGVEVGQAVQYVIRIKNDRNVSDKNVAVRIMIPQGMTYKSISQDQPVQPTFSRDGRTVQLPQIREVRAGEMLPEYLLEVTPTQPGRFTLRVEVTSLRSAEPVVQTEDTMVFARE
jgi:uncharacterized repeat protein (TIGR01451 family)